MKKALQLFLLVAVLMTAFTTSADAQYGRKKKKKKKKTEKTDDYFDDRGTFKDRLWYGADLAIRFSPIQQGNLFQGGIAPMVGYKVTDNLSVGPRFDLLYSGYRFNTGTATDLKFNGTDFGIGAFSRLKILQAYFIQLEYQSLSSAIPAYNEFGQLIVNDNKIESDRIRENHYYVGGGYSSSMGLVGIQVSLLWDLSQEFTSTNIPISYRFGINYKF